MPLGLKIGQREVRERIGLSEPQDDEELLVKPAEPPPSALPAPGKVPALPKPSAKADLVAHVVGCQCGGCLARLAADPTDMGLDGVGLVDQVLEDVDWHEISDPLLAPLAAAAARASSLEEALAMIRARGPDGAQFLEKLAIATATARGIGDVTD